MARVNTKTGYFTIFEGEDAEQNARAFGAEAQRRGLKAQVSEPDDEVFNDEEPDTSWGVAVYGPWRRLKEAERVVSALAEQFGGEYDGPEDMPL